MKLSKSTMRTQLYKNNSKPQALTILGKSVIVFSCYQNLRAPFSAYQTQFVFQCRFL
jgi:hypothetical protein